MAGTKEAAERLRVLSSIEPHLLHEGQNRGRGIRQPQLRQFVLYKGEGGLTPAAAARMGSVKTMHGGQDGHVHAMEEDQRSLGGHAEQPPVKEV